MAQSPLAGRFLAIIGPGNSADDVAALAEEAGRLAAEAGAVVVTGGRGGVMEAACRGAKEGGGTTIGLLPGNTRADANPFVDFAIPTGMGEMRNLLIVRTADAVLAIGKGYGTLSEIAFALREGKPVAGIESWELKLDHTDGVVRASSPGQALEILATLLGA